MLEGYCHRIESTCSMKSEYTYSGTSLHVQWNLVITRSDKTKSSYNEVILLVPALYISLCFYPDIIRNLIYTGNFHGPKDLVIKRFHCIKTLDILFRGKFAGPSYIYMLLYIHKIIMIWFNNSLVSSNIYFNKMCEMHYDHTHVMFYNYMQNCSTVSRYEWCEN